MLNVKGGCHVVAKKPKRWFTMALGWFLIGLGIVGLFLPLPGMVLLFALGAGLLSRESPMVKRWLHNLRERFPKLQVKEKRGNKSE